jgi:phosphoglycolate phosphatase-like HAD superfamily hydrolase
VGLLCGFGTEGELRRAGADIILNDLRELHKLLIPE